MRQGLIFLILSVIFFVFLSQLIIHTCTENNETFTFFRSPDSCPVLLDAIKDQDTYSEISKKVNTLTNDRNSFLGFRNDDPYDHKKNYCYVGPDDKETYAVETDIPCDKSHPLYDFPMIKSVNKGTILIDPNSGTRTNVNTKTDTGTKTSKSDDENRFRQKRQVDVCIMDIDREKVNPSDVIQFKDIINRHDNAYLMKSVNDFRKVLTDRQQDLNDLKEANTNLSNNLQQVRNQYDQCVSQRIQNMRRQIFTQAENDALKYKMVIISIDDYIRYDNTTQIPRLSLNLLNGPESVYDRFSLIPRNVLSRSIDIPSDFTISHIYLPPQISAKLFKENGTYVIFSHSTEGYPKTDAIDTRRTIRIQALLQK